MERILKPAGIFKVFSRRWSLIRHNTCHRRFALPVRTAPCDTYYGFSVPVSRSRGITEFDKIYSTEGNGVCLPRDVPSTFISGPWSPSPPLRAHHRATSSLSRTFLRNGLESSWVRSGSCLAPNRETKGNVAGKFLPD